MAIVDDRAKAVELALAQIEKTVWQRLHRPPWIEGSSSSDCRYLDWVHQLDAALGSAAFPVDA